MRYEFDIDWHDVKDISDDILKELLPKDDDLVRRNPCLVKYKNGDIKAFYIISTADMIKVNEQFHEPHPFKGFEFHIFKEKSVTELKDDYPVLYDKLVKSKTGNFLLLFLTLARKYLLDTEITGSFTVIM